MKISDTDPLHADSPSADSQSAVGPSSSPNNNRSPNNPFRYPNALGASSPLPYETHISNPFANNNSGYNNSTKQEYPDEKLKSQLYRGDNSYHEQQPPPSYPAPPGSPSEQIYAPPIPAPSNQYGGGYYSEHDSGDNARDSSSRNFQGSYPPQQLQPQYPQRSQQQLKDWSSHFQCQSSNHGTRCVKNKEKKTCRDEKKALRDERKALKDEKKALKDKLKDKVKALEDEKKLFKDEKKALKDRSKDEVKSLKDEKKLLKDAEKALKDEEKALKKERKKEQRLKEARR